MILKIASSIFAGRISSYPGTERRQEPQLSLILRRQDWKPLGTCRVSGLRGLVRNASPPPCFFHPPATKTEGISPGRKPVQSHQAPSVSEVLPDGNLVMQGFTFMPQLRVLLRSHTLVVLWDKNLKQNLLPSKDRGKAAGSRSWEGYTEQHRSL